MPDVEVMIELRGGSLSAKGEESFVRDIIKDYLPELKNAPAVPTVSLQNPAAVSQPNPCESSGDFPVSELSSLSNVFDVNDEKVSVSSDPPGDTMASQARNLALLYLFAKDKLGIKDVPSEEVKEQLQAHACFDSSNFSSHMKGQKKLLAVTSTKGSRNMSLRLTVPGRKAASELAETLQNES